MLQCCLNERGHKFDLHAAVVMPDHVHLICSQLRREDGWNYSLPEVMKAIKGRSARQINLALKRTGPVWQEEFFDHVLRTNDSLVDRVDYVCLCGLDWWKRKLSISGFGGDEFQSCE